MDVLIIGHSYARRLSEHIFEMRAVDSSPPFPFAVAKFQTIGFGGATLGLSPPSIRFREALTEKAKGKDLVYLIMGSNDIAQGRRPSEVAYELVSLALGLIMKGAARGVLIDALIPREATANPNSGPATARCNLEIKRAIRDRELINIHLWEHRGTDMDLTGFLAKDGVHLSHFGMQRYWRSIRRGILWASHHFYDAGVKEIPNTPSATPRPKPTPSATPRPKTTPSCPPARPITIAPQPRPISPVRPPSPCPSSVHSATTCDSQPPVTFSTHLPEIIHNIRLLTDSAEARLNMAADSSHKVP